MRALDRRRAAEQSTHAQRRVRHGRRFARPLLRVSGARRRWPGDGSRRRPDTSLPDRTGGRRGGGARSRRVPGRSRRSGTRSERSRLRACEMEGQPIAARDRGELGPRMEGGQIQAPARLRVGGQARSARAEPDSPRRCPQRRGPRRPHGVPARRDAPQRLHDALRAGAQPYRGPVLRPPLPALRGPRLRERDDAQLVPTLPDLVPRVRPGAVRLGVGDARRDRGRIASSRWRPTAPRMAGS